ncbi:hypothetical protein HELRODRAFT_166778 [Helobdella robusta]|uniref:Endonuclease/exonuclease/phosphatase domain-containing protein n=1 Tax=Helobdella robusta TaxID=6412 RepID=T1EYI5_HELRO|nr:hypothetical protein HELRODRAFT_166778 [Helobdella robusta]ESO11750.1 hypothetical protein HELRODRAFT_166778 [Helobdella robusta]
MNKINEIRVLIDNGILNKHILIFTEANLKNITTEINENEIALRGFKIESANFMKKKFRGDFNYPRIDWGTLSINSESKSIEKIFVNLVKDLFLHQVVQEPTRFRSLQANHILDLILVEELDEIKNLVHLPPLGKSDHCILCFEVGSTIDGAREIINKTRLNFNEGDYELMNKYLHKNLYGMLNKELSVADLGSYVNSLWCHFSSVINRATEEHIPVVKMGKNSCKGEISKSLQELIKIKKRLWKKYMKTRDSLIFEDF